MAIKDIFTLQYVHSFFFTSGVSFASSQSLVALFVFCQSFPLSAGADVAVSPVLTACADAL